jgi:hypothetical protein
MHHQKKKKKPKQEKRIGKKTGKRELIKENTDHL